MLIYRSVDEGMFVYCTCATKNGNKYQVSRYYVSRYFTISAKSLWNWKHLNKFSSQRRASTAEFISRNGQQVHQSTTLRAPEHYYQVGKTK